MDTTLTITIKFKLKPKAVNKIRDQLLNVLAQWLYQGSIATQITTEVKGEE